MQRLRMGQSGKDNIGYVRWKKKFPYCGKHRKKGLVLRWVSQQEEGKDNRNWPDRSDVEYNVPDLSTWQWF